ncbi:hypothetical protein U1Q18_049892, partial [Sarracenia purpurea var. burkii]
ELSLKESYESSQELVQSIGMMANADPTHGAGSRFIRNTDNNSRFNKAQRGQGRSSFNRSRGGKFVSTNTSTSDLPISGK